MVELALILPILLTIVVAIFQFGEAYNAKIAIQGAAREGARAQALQQNVTTAVNGAISGTGLVVGITPTGCATATDTAPARVRVTTTYTFSIPFVTLGARTLAAEAEMRCGL